MFLTIYLAYFKIFTIIFSRRDLIIKKKDSENVPTQIHDYERRLCSQT